MVARFKDESELIIDALNKGGGSVQIFNSQKEHVAAVIAHREKPTGEFVTITAYFPTSNLAKRVYDLRCGKYEPAPKGKLDVRNFTFNAKDKTIIFDLVSSCGTVVVNANSEINLKKHNSDSGPFGNRVYLELTDNHHVKLATTKFSSEGAPRVRGTFCEMRGCSRSVGPARGRAVDML